MPDSAPLASALLRPLLELMAHHLGGAVILHAAPSGQILLAVGGLPGLAFDKAVGATAEDYVGRFQVYAQDGSEAKMEALPVVRAMTTGEPVVDEVWLLGAGGGAAPVPVFVDSYPLKDDSGAVIGVIATSTDPRRWATRAERLKQSISLRDRSVRD